MRPRRSAISTALLCAALAGLATSAARADEKEAGGVWVYDVRVVRVDLPRPEVAEEPGPFADMRGSTIALPWGEALARLRKRGSITLLLDQRITTETGVVGRAKTERMVPRAAVNQESGDVTIKRSVTIKTGCSFEVTPRGNGFAYQLAVMWALEAPDVGDYGPAQMTTNWYGTHPTSGQTLVLRYREQIPKAGGAALQGVELYGLITERHVPAR